MLRLLTFVGLNQMAVDEDAIREIDLMLLLYSDEKAEFHRTLHSWRADPF